MIDPVKLCCGRKSSEHNGAQCPDGTFMCDTCFQSFPPEKASVDEEGQKWSICLTCKIHENEMVELCNWIKAVQDEEDRL